MCFGRCDIIRRALLLLAVPTLLWGRCGRHNSPPASFVVDILRCSDGSHVRFHTGYLSLLWSSSSSSPSCSHVVVGLLRQTQFSFSQFCRGHPPPLLRWLSCQIYNTIQYNTILFISEHSTINTDNYAIA